MCSVGTAFKDCKQASGLDLVYEGRGLQAANASCKVTLENSDNVNLENVTCRLSCWTKTCKVRRVGDESFVKLILVNLVTVTNLK